MNNSPHDEWRQDVRDGDYPPGIHGHYDLKDHSVAWFRKDSRNRVRRVEGDTHELDLTPFPSPPGMSPRFPHPDYVYGYERAVAYEYELITLELFMRQRSWRPEVDTQADGLCIWENLHGTYRPWVEHYKDIARIAKRERPTLLKLLMPIAQRHGLDVVPWGMGWMVEQVASEHIEPISCCHNPEYRSDTEFPTGPPNPMRTPEKDALLLYVYLTGHLTGHPRDRKAWEIVLPVINLFSDEDDGALKDPKRKVQEIKRALGATRKPGRPAGRPRSDTSASKEVYELLERQVEYLLPREV